MDTRAHVLCNPPLPFWADPAQAMDTNASPAHPGAGEHQVKAA